MLYRFIYKEKVVKDALIEASSLEKAEEMGRRWCEEGADRRFIGVRDAVLLREKAEVKAVEQGKEGLWGKK